MYAYLHYGIASPIALCSRNHPYLQLEIAYGGKGACCRRHGCFDEVSIDQRMAVLPHRDGHVLFGNASATPLVKAPEQKVLILTRGTDMQESQLIVEVTAPGSVPVRAVHDLDKLEGIVAQEKRATELCVWLLHDAVRGGQIAFAGAAPICGDTTALDDQVHIHRIAQALAQCGSRPVTFWGADGKHLALIKGLQRQMSDLEDAYICSAVEDGTAETDNDVLVLASFTGRPIGVLQAAIRLVKRGDQLCGNSEFERQLPYPGLGYSSLLCQTSGVLLNVSHEWRHNVRLLVSCPQYLHYPLQSQPSAFHCSADICWCAPATGNPAQLSFTSLCRPTMSETSQTS